MAIEWGIYLQDSVSPIIEEYDFFNEYSQIIIGFVFVLAIFLLLSCYVADFPVKEDVDGEILEAIWTIIPSAVVVQIGIPSLSLLFVIETHRDPRLIVKAIGHQWYWSYEYPQTDLWGDSVEYDSYLLTTPQARDRDCVVYNLDVDNRVVFPGDTTINLIISSRDVLHSWALPAAGIKVDAIPGRINEIETTFFRSGLYFGQCSEICGTNHRFIPIGVEVVDMDDFCVWIRHLIFSD